jgi:WD repeat-containing protein 76
MAPRTVPILSEYEQKRQEQIAKNKALFQDLNLAAAASGIAPKRPAPKSTPAKRATRKSDANDGKENQEPSRRSLRIRNIGPDNVAAKRQAEEELERRVEEERAKKRRRSGDLNVSDLITSGESWDSTGNFLRGVAPPKPYERSFDVESAKGTSDKAVKEAIERMSGLRLWEDVEPNSMYLSSLVFYVY